MTVLFGFPGAGAGKNVFEIWQTSLGSEIVFHEVLYSGRMFQPGCKDMKEAAERCAQQVRGAVREDDDIYFFGHCMGAAVAYETAKYLQVHCDMHIRGLFISAFISRMFRLRMGFLIGMTGNLRKRFAVMVHFRKSFL